MGLWNAYSCLIGETEFVRISSRNKRLTSKNLRFISCVIRHVDCSEVGIDEVPPFEVTER
jgi:hypothetical protein